MEKRVTRSRLATNLTIDPRITAIAKQHVATNHKLPSLSRYMEILLVRDLRRKGVRLPLEYATA